MPDGSRDYAPLQRHVLRTMLVTCLVPLLLVGTASYLQFGHYARQMVLDQQQRVVLNHAHFIDAFLHRLRVEMRAITEEYTLQELLDGELARALRMLQRSTTVYTDLGIIDDRGHHVKYVGPYGLEGRNYGQTDWFERLKREEIVISDLFLGYRGVPHFIIAVKRQTDQGYWILRASLSLDEVSELVESIRVGQTGEAFLLDRQGLFQTRTRFPSRLLSPSGLPLQAPHEGVRLAELDLGGRSYLFSDVWTAGGQWLLVFRQEKAEAFAPLDRTLWTTGFIILAGLGGVAVAALAISRGLVRHVQKADRESDSLHAQLLASSKMAAIGEMATGVAHEINNPLGNIETLRTWILDLVTERGLPAEDAPEVMASARRIGDQVERCRLITHDLLRFSRRSESERVPTHVEALLRELLEMVEHRARSENVRFQVEAEPMPQAFLSPSKLQQILLNLLNNAVDAMQGNGGTITVGVRKRGDRLVLSVADTGSGIAKEHLPRIFEPFFTTKPVGRGTGLGLAVCYGLAQQMGGTLTVESRLGVGSTFTLDVPFEPVPEAPRLPPGPGPEPGRPVADHRDAAEPMTS